MSNQTESIAAYLYAVYCNAVGGKAFNGDPLPAWPEFSADPKKQTQADGWRMTAAAAESHGMTMPANGKLTL